MATKAEPLDSSGTERVSSLKGTGALEELTASVPPARSSSCVSDARGKVRVPSVDAEEEGSRLAFLWSVLGMEESVSGTEGDSRGTQGTGVGAPDFSPPSGRKSLAESETSKGEGDPANLRGSEREQRLCRATKSEGGSVHSRSGYPWNRKIGTGGGNKRGTFGFEESRSCASLRHFDSNAGGISAAASGSGGKKSSAEVIRSWGTADSVKGGADRRNARGSGSGSQGVQQNLQKRGQDDQRRAELQNSTGVGGQPTHPGSGCLPNLLLNDSALALQTALVALLQLQKQGQDGVQKKPVIPRR